MPTVMVNARVDAEDKRAADQVLAASRRTWSEAIQALSSYMARTRAFPAELDQPAEDETAERQRALDTLLGVAGISAAPELATDAGADQVLRDAMTRRHG